MDKTIHKKISLFINNKTEPHPEYEAVEIHQVQFIEEGSVDSVFCNCLDYFVNPEQLLLEITKRVKYGGEITVEGGEIYEIMRDVLIGEIEPNEINKYLYSGKQSSISSLQLVQFFKNNNFTILDKDVDNYKFMIRGFRNGVV